MYKIISIKEENLEDFKGKIVSVIDKHKVEVPRYNYLGRMPSYMSSSQWELTCLVEVKNNERKS